MAHIQLFHLGMSVSGSVSRMSWPGPSSSYSWLLGKRGHGSAHGTVLAFCDKYSALQAVLEVMSLVPSMSLTPANEAIKKWRDAGQTWSSQDLLGARAAPADLLLGR